MKKIISVILSVAVFVSALTITSQMFASNGAKAQAAEVKGYYETADTYLYQSPTTGNWKDWFFIDGIDIEYCMNLHKNGYKIIRVNSVEIDHNLGDIFYKNIRGRLFLCTNHVPIRRYYIMRNYHYIKDMYEKDDPGYCYSLISQRHNMIGVILFEKDKIKKIRMYIRGLKDYKKGIKGKYPYKR